MKLNNEGFGNYIESLINNFVQNTNELSIDRLDNNSLEEIINIKNIVPNQHISIGRWMFRASNIYSLVVNA